jgi:hypothetical protein
MKVLIIGGTWDEKGGKPSKIMQSLTNCLSDCSIINGGHYNHLEKIIQFEKSEFIEGYEVIIWAAHVPNHLPKVRDIKQHWPHKMLVTTKRNIDNQYDFNDLIAHALNLKSNLFIEIGSDGQRLRFRVADPLGNIWSSKLQKEWYYDLNTMSNEVLIPRLEFLQSVTRKSTNMILEAGPSLEVIEEDKVFVDKVRNLATEFDRLINPSPQSTRFLGNASFRCTKGGFPSMRKGEYIFVSPRNMDKGKITPDYFVATYMDKEGNIFYWGPQKPSVDTPIQLYLYSMLPNINYMIHSHTYVELTDKNKPRSGSYRESVVNHTEKMIPCGGLEERDEIYKAMCFGADNNKIRTGAINLVGHGSIIMGKRVEDLNGYTFVKRELPEILIVERGEIDE